MKTPLLDPIGTMCKLISLQFTDIKTKLSIHDHILTLQEPTNLQWLVRLYNGDGRENSSELYYAIIRLVKWFLMYSEPSMQLVTYSLEQSTVLTNLDQISRSPELRKLVSYMCAALRKLQVTYSEGNVVLALQFYINIVEDGLAGTYSDSRLPQHLYEKELEHETIIDYDKLKNMWTLRRIVRICELYESCFKVLNDPESKQTEKDAFIDGYLRSIRAILDSTDEEFQKLINDSNHG